MKKVLSALAALQIKMPIETVLLVLIVAFIVALIIFITYKHTYTGVLYNPRFNVSLMMITMVTTVVMCVIGSNISVSLGMVGALSIIRFRTAVKDPRDTAFIFWGVVSGLACGTQNYIIAVVGSLFICIMLFIFKKISASNDKYILVVKGDTSVINEAEKVIKSTIKDNNLKGRYIKNNDFELVYDIKVHKDNDKKATNELNKIKGITTINIISSNTDTMG